MSSILAFPAMIFFYVISKVVLNHGAVIASKIRATCAKISDEILALPEVRLLDGGGSHRRKLRQQANQEKNEGNTLKANSTEAVGEVVTVNKDADCCIYLGACLGFSHAFTKQEFQNFRSK